MKDMLGNELKIGDCVLCKYGSEWMSGVVSKLQNGGLSLGMGNLTQKNPQQQVTADVVVLQVTIPLMGQPGNSQPFIARLDAKNQVDAVIESSMKM